MLMRKARRLLLLATGLMVLCSGSFNWLNDQLPINASFGQMLSSVIAQLSGGSVIINLSVLNQITLSTVLFVLGVIIMIAAVLGSKAIALAGALLVGLVTAGWFIMYDLSFTDLFTNFTVLGLGTQMSLAGIILVLLIVLLPRLKLPGKGGSSAS